MLAVESRENLFKYFKRDMIAGTITGLMAIPLSIGICLMSDFPILVGLVTVVFACIIGFITYLFKPGNYVGTPGIAAGLAPALALGVQHFGMENMPFLIFLTSLMQIIVWKFNLQRFILKSVPKYLVEGLLAGIGLKIALKFLPFLYTTVHTHENFFHQERIILMAISLVAFIIFIALFLKFQKTSPGIPYITLITFGVVSLFFVEEPILKLENIDLKFVLPLPHPSYFHGETQVMGILKMFGYAAMLGSIDVIEQVMSNAAIEKLDPLNRHCDTNNSLLAIWIANIGSSFFGGMTNLDGLAKSSTNAFAGAYTKLSNLFCALVISIFIIFHNLLDYLPQYALGIIMIFSGWKMISGLNQVRLHHSKYALFLAVVCGLLVYKLGIFEGLLLCLGLHVILSVVMMKMEKKTFGGIWEDFKARYKET
jgi:MFS superfamily sulfate permease-like transporter